MRIPSSDSRVLFRADGNTVVGLGHLVRCQALAQALQPAFLSVFVLRDPSPGISQQLADAGLLVVAVPDTVGEVVAVPLLAGELIATSGKARLPNV